MASKGIQTKEKKMQRNNKINKVQQHLLENGQKGINTWQAIELYGDTRLSGTIWYLKHKRSMDIKSRLEHGKNRYGQPIWFTTYYLESEENNG